MESMPVCAGLTDTQIDLLWLLHYSASMWRAVKMTADLCKWSRCFAEWCRHCQLTCLPVQPGQTHQIPLYCCNLTIAFHYVSFSHKGRLKGKEERYFMKHLKALRHGSHSFTQITSCLPFLRKHSPDGATLTEVGRRPPTTFGVRKLQWLSFRVVSKYLQCIVWFWHKAHVIDEQD